MAPRTELGWKVGVGVGKPRQKRLYRTGSFLLKILAASILNLCFLFVRVGSLGQSEFIELLVVVKIFVDKY